MRLVNVEDIYPLTPVQQGLLFHTLYAPGCGLYCSQVSCTIRGELDTGALREAWERAMQRHPVLRTAFLWDGLEQPLQVVRERLTLPWLEEDWRGLESGERSRRWSDLLRMDRERGFALDEAPLLRLTLVRVADGEHRFLWSHHHLLLDGWSTARVFADVQAGYRALHLGEPLVLPESRPYRDYLAWLSDRDLADAQRYWQDTLAGRQAPTALPLRESRADAPASSQAYGARELVLSGSASAALGQRARRLRVTLSTLMQAAWALLLSRYSGERDVVLGVTLSGRPPELDGIESMVGLFINTLPLRVRIPDETDLGPWLAQLHARVVELQVYGYSPLVQVQAWSGVPAGVPLFETLLVFESYPIQGVATGATGGPEIADIESWERTNYPLSAVVLPGPEIRLRLLYDGERIDPALIEPMLGHWRALLERLADDREQTPATLDPLTEPERRLLAACNDTARAYPRDGTLHRLFEAQAARRPDAPAVVWGEEVLSYGLLNRRANRLARHLQSRGASEGALVALHLPRSPELIVALLAILKAGCAYVPLDTAYPRERLALMLRDCEPQAVLTSADLSGGLDAGQTPVVVFDAVVEETAHLSHADLPVSAAPERLAYVIYTSGSTGLPKGVAVPHRAVLRLVLGTDYVDLGPGERIAQASNASFDAATFEIWGALLTGGTLVGVDRDTLLSPPDFAALLRAERISTLFLTTALFNQMAREAPGAFAGLRHLLFGGEQVDPARVREVLRDGAPQRLLHVYGPTENTTFSTWHPVEALSAGALTVPIGRPIANSTAYVLDPRLEPLPVGVAGELYVGGDGLAAGYLGQPELTAARFVPNPFDGGATRLYRTGDIVRRLPDGALVFVGRHDNQVKIRGFRVELGDIEAALLTHPAVREAVAIFADGRLAAYLVAAGGTPPERAELRRWLARKLPEYMIPADLMMLPALPLNANGKVDRGHLPEIPRGEESAAAPRGPVEEILAGIWAAVLGLPEVGADANFFDLGGHSLLATQAISRVRDAFRVDLPLRALFQHPTVAGLARQIEAARGQADGAPPAILPTARGNAPALLSFAQERLWFLDRLEPGNPFYNVPIALALTGPLDESALRYSIEAVVQRHEVLRTTFPAVDGRPLQSITPVAAVGLPVDLCGGDDEAARLIAEEALKPFDLARGPLLRTRLLRLAPDRHALLLTMHHIVADGWSLGVLVEELAPLYRHFRSAPGACAAGALPLPELPIQYADFAAWQREWLASGVMEAQLAYWKAQLADAPPTLDLPTDRPRPPAQSYRGSSVRFAVEPEPTAALRRLGRRHDATLFMTLLAAFATLLHRCSGQDDLTIGSPIANRNRGEIEPLIGFFVNTLALRIDLTGNPSFETLLARVRSTALDAYAHQDLPFERLVDELQPERDLSLNPLFQVMLALQNAPVRRLDLGELEAELVETKHQVAIFDLVLDFWEVGNGLVGVLEYSTDLLDLPSAERIGRNLCTLLESAAADPARPVGELSLLTGPERDLLLRMGTGPRREYPVDSTLHALFERAAAEHPERIAAVHNGLRVTYAELDTRANRIARRLRRLGVGRSEPVAILEERGPDLLAAMLGILKAGGAFLPLDPAYPAERIRYMLADSGVRVLVSRTARLAEAEADAFAGYRLRLDADDRVDEPVTPPAPLSGPADLAYLLYTSGSTGLPKGALVRHNGAVNHICAEVELLGLSRDTAFLQSAPSSSDISVWQLLGPCLIGARTVIADYETVCDPALLMRLLREERITLIELVPAAMGELLELAGRLAPHERALPVLDCAMVTGEAASPVLVERWQTTYPEIQLVNAYGPTEAADDICQCVLDRPLGSDRSVVPIGRPLPNLTLYVLDRRLDLVPLGVPGEICVSGIGVGAGYWRDAARTGESFVANPYAGEGRGEVLYRTGDRGRWLPGGTLELRERLDDQVKLRGFRIELGEIEGILKTYPAVREAAVAIRGGAMQERQLAAYVVPDTESAEVRAELEDVRRAQVELWTELHDNSYRDELLRGDVTFNVIGWDSSYTGQPLPEADMREYVAHSIERIRALDPRRVLEIGCGTGLIMFALLPHCTAYTGTDLSQVAVARLQELRDSLDLRARMPGLERVELLCRRAHDLDWLTPGGCDTAVLASVSQYFPGIDYLLEVLDALFGRALAVGGAVFVGDVRSLPLLEAFHASVELHRAAPEDRAAALAERTRQRLAREQEMAIDPAFFLALKQRYPAIAEVEILPKRGMRHNEMTRFRYDVLIRTGTAAPVPAPDWTDWRVARPDVAALRRTLSEERPRVLALRRVANARVAEALAVAQALRSAEPDTAAERLREIGAAAPAGLEPEELRQLGRELDYRVDLSLARGYADGSFDAVFRPLESASVQVPPPGQAQCAIRSWSRYANNPLQEKLARRMAPRLREHLKERLPHYMVPTHFALLSDLPLTPAGKVNRSALPPPDASAGLAERTYVAPRSREEQVLARIWSEVLGLARVGIHHDFFELGGHSLKATQVASRIERDLLVRVALRDLFAYPTIAELAPRLETARPAARSPIPKAPAAEDYPLSHAQRRLWVLSQLEGASVAYNMPVALSIEGPLSTAAFGEAFDRLAERHEALRTVFVSPDGRPRQRILPANRSVLATLDLSAREDPEEAARELALADAAAPFDLERGPPIRASLLRLSESRHVLLLNLHHIASDDWSLSVAVRELVELYSAIDRGEPPQLPPLGLQYRDYACWQKDYLASEAGAAHRAYWHGKLSGTLPVLDLATDLPRPPIKTYRGRSCGFAFDAGTAAALAALARERRVSLFMVLAAAVKVLLYRWTGQQDILVGFPIAGRDHPDLEDQIGFYVNTLPLRDWIEGSESFLDLLERVRTTATEAYEHQAYPFDLLVDELQVSRDVSRSPMLDVIVVMQNAGTPAPPITGILVRPFLRDYPIGKFDLGFAFEEREGELLTDITYNTDLFLPARIARMAAQLRELIAGLLKSPAQRVDRLPILPPVERRLILEDWTPRPVVCARGPTLVGLFEARAARTPERIALVQPEVSADVSPTEAGPRRTLSYRELNERANRLAHRLRRMGAGPDVPVGLCLPRSPELIVALLGILKSGAAYLPLDPAHPAERLAFMLGDAGAPIVVTDSGLAERAAAGAATRLCIDTEEEALVRESTDNPAPLAGPDRLAYVIYTSGSTGRPKGVAVTQHNVVRLFATTEPLFGFGEDDCWTLFHSIAFDFSVWELWGALLYGGRLAIVPHWVSRVPEAFLDLLEREGITVLNQTPSAFRQLIQADEDSGGTKALALRCVVFGGEALDPGSLRPWIERHGDERPRLVNMYGITETTVHVTYRPLSRADLGISGSRIGRALPDLKLCLLDPHGEPVPVGVAGEICVGGDGLARGYLNRPELTAERFVGDPFSADPQALLYRSGDLGRFLPDGDIEYLGREDQQVQIRGFRVEPGEIEAALIAHPEVREAVVLAHGEGARMRLSAYYVPAPGAAPSAESLRRFLRERLPEYMVPAATIPLDAFPLTVNGKLDRAALPPPESRGPGTPGPEAEPAGELECFVAGLLRDTLGLERVGLHDNFFDLGANSLILVQVHRRLRERLGREVPVVLLFQFPTVAGLAARLSDTGPVNTPALREAEERAARRKAARGRRGVPTP